MIFACRIHNNSLEQCIQVDTWENGIEQITKWIKDKFGDITEKELEILDITGEYCNNDDVDNLFAFVLIWKM